jgi:hypothetical protein
MEELNSKKIEGEMWVNGSFLTQKTNPNDVDLVLRLQADFYDNASVDKKEAVQWLSDDLKISHGCDSYFFMEWPENHPHYRIGKDDYDYWMRLWGFSRGNSAQGINPEMKGIAVIELPGNTV